MDAVNKSSKCLGISKDIEEACETICLGFSLNISLGVLQLADGSRYYFHHSANVGFNAAIIHQTTSMTLNKITRKGFSAVSSIGKVLFDKPKKFDVHYSDCTLVGTSLIVGNGELFELPFDQKINRLLSNRLQSCLLTDDQKFPVAEFLLRGGLGNHSKMKQVRQFDSEEILIHKPNIPISIDGEFIGNTPAKFSRLANAYPIITHNYDLELVKK